MHLGINGDKVEATLLVIQVILKVQKKKTRWTGLQAQW